MITFTFFKYESHNEQPSIRSVRFSVSILGVQNKFNGGLPAALAMDYIELRSRKVLFPSFHCRIRYLHPLNDFYVKKSAKRSCDSTVD